MRETKCESDGMFWAKVDKTLRHYGRSVIHALRGGWWDIMHLPAVRPIFVVGCSRAGTTLVYKTFSESTALGSLQRETHDFWMGLHPLASRGWQSHALDDTDATDRDRSLATRMFFRETGRRRFVDKNNQNGLCVKYLQALWPDAYFVYVKRSPGDNINSLMEGWRRPGEFATWSADLPAKVAIDRGRVTRWCFFLPEGWRDYVTASLEEVCAFQYRAMNESILAGRQAVDERRWVELAYEELVADPVGGFARAYESCGVPFPTEVRRHCETVLKRPYNSFSEIRLDKWRDGSDRERIERMLPSVAAVAAQMGYSDV
ncbi:MAG: sulfotransferase [Gammaproteobacteria bacterium]